MTVVLSAVNPTVPDSGGPIAGSALALLAVLAFVAIGAAVGRTRRRPLLGAVLGVLGPVGWLVAALVPSRRPEVGSTVERIEAPRAR
jgi:hypothetical protein